MPYIPPAIPDFKAQFVRDFPYAVPLSPAGGSGAVLTPTNAGANNGIDTLVITAGGASYPARSKPDIIIYGGGGFGATAKVATITAGVVVAVSILTAGYNYLLLPTVYISSGMGDNTNQEKVTDYDIAAGFSAALNFNFSQALFGSQAAFTQAANLLSAHYLCQAVQAGGTGLGGKAEWITMAKTVGNVTESYRIPDRVMRSPYLSKLSRTTYGAQFLELVSPQLIGNYQIFQGMTQP